MSIVKEIQEIFNKLKSEYIVSSVPIDNSKVQHFNAWGWCTGMIQRDDMGWEVGGGFRIGNSCTPVADSCQRMAKSIQYYKAK